MFVNYSPPTWRQTGGYSILSFADTFKVPLRPKQLGVPKGHEEDLFWLVVEPTSSEKYCIVKMGIFPKFRAEQKKVVETNT